MDGSGEWRGVLFWGFRDRGGDGNEVRVGGVFVVGGGRGWVLYRVRGAINKIPNRYSLYVI